VLSVISSSNRDGGNPVSLSTDASKSANPGRRICRGDTLTAMLGSAALAT